MPTTNKKINLDLKVVVGSRVSKHQQCALAGGKVCSIQGCVNRSISGRSREMIMPLYVALIRSHLLYFVNCPVLGPSTRKMLEEAPWGVTNMTEVWSMSLVKRA